MADLKKPIWPGLYIICAIYSFYCLKLKNDFLKFYSGYSEFEKEKYMLICGH